MALARRKGGESDATMHGKAADRRRLLVPIAKLASHGSARNIEAGLVILGVRPCSGRTSTLPWCEAGMLERL